MKKQKINIRFVLNGQSMRYAVEPNWTLLSFLREELGITSPKQGCNLGECGACTVLVNDEPVSSCLTLASQIDGKKVTTIEGISQDGKPNEIQLAFMENNALQCGYCTPGMILATKALLDRNPNPNVDDIKKALTGHLCRCTGYINIVDAVLDASKRLQKKN